MPALQTAIFVALAIKAAQHFLSCAPVSLTGNDCVLLDHLFKLILRDYGDAERTCFVELAAGSFAREDERCFLRYRGGRLAAVGFNDRACLVPRILRECSGENERFAEKAVLAALLAAEHIHTRLAQQTELVLPAGWKLLDFLPDRNAALVYQAEDALGIYDLSTGNCMASIPLSAGKPP